MARQMHLRAKFYAEGVPHWDILIPLRDGRMIVLECVLEDLENLHAVVRGALRDHGNRKLSALEAEHGYPF